MAEARRSLMSWNPISERIITARFPSKVRYITIFQCYAPTDTKSAAVKDAFYSELSAFYRNVLRDIMIVMDDLKLLLVKAMSMSNILWANDNGEYFIDFCNANDLVFGGTLFPHKCWHRITWMTPREKHKKQIDHLSSLHRLSDECQKQDECCSRCCL